MPRQNRALTGKPYRPSNGTEGDLFMAHLCQRCVAFADCGAECEIVMRAFAFDIDDADYPLEWMHDGEGWPTCTAFSAEKGAEPRCPNTLDLFGAVT
jgi:hypothetical protein